MKQLDGGLIVPGIARVSTREAPKPTYSAGMGGWIEWQLIDRWGRVVRAGEQHNLLLNQGLNSLPAYGGAGSELAQPHIMFQGLELGTGSAEPAVTDTALSNHAATVTAAVGNPPVTRTANGVYQMTRTFEADFNEANGNLTEWGVRLFGAVVLGTRELFRDSGGDAIVVTKTSDYKLRVTYTLEIQLTPVTPAAASFNITGIGTINGSYQWIAGPSSYHFDLKAFFNLVVGYVGSSSTDGAVATSEAGLTYTGSYAFNSRVTPTFSAFVAGTWERSASCVFGTNAANETIESIGLVSWGSTSAERRMGYKFDIDSGDRFTKDNQHMLTITDLLTVTWGRA